MEGRKMSFRTAFASLVFVAATISAVSSLASEAAFPWKAGDNPPAVAGIALGDTEQHVRDVLGEPTTTSEMGAANVLEYPAKGLEISATRADGVSIIRLRTPAAGSIDDIKIGDEVSAVIAKWGHPSEG